MQVQSSESWLSRAQVLKSNQRLFLPIWAESFGDAFPRHHSQRLLPASRYHQNESGDHLLVMIIQSYVTMPSREISMVHTADFARYMALTGRVDHRCDLFTLNELPISRPWRIDELDFIAWIHAA